MRKGGRRVDKGVKTGSWWGTEGGRDKRDFGVGEGRERGRECMREGERQCRSEGEKVGTMGQPGRNTVGSRGSGDWEEEAD